jgi:hypothetical protein
MVFSFFKKPPPEKKMPVRPAAVPPSADDRGAASAASSKEKPKPAAAPVGLARSDVPFADSGDYPRRASAGLSEFVFSEIAAEFQVEAELDPLDAEAEEAAMLYSNGQDAAVRSCWRRRSASGPLAPVNACG